MSTTQNKARRARVREIKEASEREWYQWLL